MLVPNASLATSATVRLKPMRSVVAVHATIVAFALPAAGVAHPLDTPAGAPVSAAAEAFGSSTPYASWAVAALGLAAALYGLGLWRLWRASAPGRGVGALTVVAFCSGWWTLALALLGPLDRWAAQSFAAHMLQHQALMLVAAPLLVLGRPLAVCTWALSSSGKARVRSVVSAAAWRRAWHWATRVPAATLLQLVALFAWHAPATFSYTTTHPGVHVLQHASLLATALCFWWALQAPVRPRTKAAGLRIACLLATMLASGALGALLTFAPAPWYRVYAEVALPWASSALEDQQLGGLLMWVPGGAVYLGAALLHASRLLARDDAVHRGGLGHGAAPGIGRRGGGAR